MSATILDSRFVAAQKRDELIPQIAEFTAQTGNPPNLVMLCIGEDAATLDYVRIVTSQSRRVGIRAVAHLLSDKLSHEEVVEHIEDLNNNPKIHAVALQTPLPPHLKIGDVSSHIHPDKDVEGYHPANAGAIRRGSPRLIPTPALGALQRLDAYQIDPSGMQAVVVERNAIIGKPLAALLMDVDASVTVAHRGTPNLPALIGQADLLVLGASIEGGIPTRALKPGVIILDFGINYVADGEDDIIKGNINFEEAVQIAGAITPMPGGTGPMTTVSILQNTLKAAQLQVA